MWWRELYGSDESLGREPLNAHGGAFQPSPARLGQGEKRARSVLCGWRTQG